MSVRIGSESDFADPHPVRVWDPLVRIFHWTLAASFFTAFLVEDPAWLHENTGYAALGLIAVRLVWGMVGTEHARFGDFVPRPRTLWRYLGDLVRLRAKRHLGHNPAGGAMILALLSIVVLTAGSGVLMTMDRFWGDELVEDVHESLANITIALIALHVGGVVVSSLMHRENLVRAMISGYKRP